MFKFKIFISVIIFSFLLVGTSIIKNNTRAIEKKIYNSKNRIYIKERDLNESQLDYSYLTSPSILEQKIKIIDTEIESWKNLLENSDKSIKQLNERRQKSSSQLNLLENKPNTQAEKKGQLT